MDYFCKSPLDCLYLLTDMDTGPGAPTPPGHCAAKPGVTQRPLHPQHQPHTLARAKLTEMLGLEMI